MLRTNTYVTVSAYVSLNVKDEHICHNECVSMSLDVEDEHIIYVTVCVYVRV